MALGSPRFAGNPVLESCLAGHSILAFGDVNDAVTLLQQALIDLGYPIPDGATGGFYTQTQAAVRAFQVAHGLSADAKVGPYTLGALDVAVTQLDAGGTEPVPPPPQAPTATPEEPERPVGDAVAATDWQCAGVAQVGAAAGTAAALYCFEFRSRAANVRGQYLFVGVGLGAGGSLGGGTAPGPGDVIHNQLPDLWTSLLCIRAFSANDLHKAYGALGTVGAGIAYGYSLVRISAGQLDRLFADQDVSGWGTGLGASAAGLAGVWVRIGQSGYY